MAVVQGNPFATLKKALQKTAREQVETRRAVAGTVKALIRDQFAAGVDPEGAIQPATSSGKAAFLSSSLPNAIKVAPSADGVEGTGELKENRSGRARRQWLNAHQLGHEFPARTSSGWRVATNAKGQRTTVAKLKKAASASTKTTVRSSWLGLKKTTKTRTTAESKRVTVGQREAFWREQKTRSKLVGRITNVKAHKVGARVLVPRRIYPMGQLGARWARGLRTTLQAVLAKQLERNVKGG